MTNARDTCKTDRYSHEMKIVGAERYLNKSKTISACRVNWFCPSVVNTDVNSIVPSQTGTNTSQLTKQWRPMANWNRHLPINRAIAASRHINELAADRGLHTPVSVIAVWRRPPSPDSHRSTAGVNTQPSIASFPMLDNPDDDELRSSILIA